MPYQEDQSKSSKCEENGKGGRNIGNQWPMTRRHMAKLVSPGNPSQLLCHVGHLWRVWVESLHMETA